MPRRLLAALAPIVVLLAAAGPAAAQTPQKPTTPQLIERAGLSKAQELRMLAYAVGRPGRLPARFRSNAPWDGTMPLLRLQREAPKLRDAAARREIMGILAPDGGRINPSPSTNCSVLSVGPNPEVYESDYFFIEYLPGAFTGGLTIEDYAESLDGAWEKQVNEFGYAAPPIKPGTPTGKYNVRIGLLGAGLYGFVSSSGTYAGEVGDNPNTAWTEDDADASCMGLNADYETGFEQLTVGTPRQRLDATTAHEFFHSIHFGYGALDNGDHEPDLSFTEGFASWMEDEVYDGADDNQNYLYPAFDDSMGEHEASEYAYWLTFRGLTERFGTGTPGPHEEFSQRFWEIISREEFGPMDAVENAYSTTTGLSLASGFHDYARAARFLKQCGGGYVLPFCFEEADAYADVAGGRPEPHGSIDSVTGSHGSAEEPAEIEDNYAINWVDLPAPDQDIEAVLDHRGEDGGALRMSIVCDTGTELRVSTTAEAREDSDGILRFDPRGCTSRPSAVITNEKRTGGPDPEESTMTPYVLRADLAPPLQPQDAPPPETQPVPVTPFVAPPPPPPVACAAGSRLGRANAFMHPRGVRFSFRPRAGSRIGIDVFQSSIGRRVMPARLVARFRGRQRSFVWDGRSNLDGRRVRNGYLFVRFRARNATGVDVKHDALVRRRGVFRGQRKIVFRGRPAFATADRCATLASFRLLRPVFGGRTNRSLGVSYRVNRVARVTLEAVEKGVVVARYREGFREPGRTFRLRVRPRRFVRGDVTFRLRVERQGARPVVARLVARKL